MHSYIKLSNLYVNFNSMLKEVTWFETFILMGMEKRRDKIVKMFQHRKENTSTIHIHNSKIQQWFYLES